MKISGYFRRVLGTVCILATILLLTTGQDAEILAAALDGQPAAGKPMAAMDADLTGVIVLLDSLPVSAYRRRITGGSPALGEAQIAQIRGYSRKIESEQARFLETARQSGVAFTVQRRYNFLLNGFALTLPAPEIEQLARLPGVSGVYLDRPVKINLADSVPLIGADRVWSLLDPDGQAVTGQGMRVAVIDTGIDYTHPDLGGCYGAGCKVVSGYDLHNNDANPLDDNGHGTLCAGIVAANGGLKGVAPGASLYAYKVLDASGSGSISVIIAGIERAADPDQDPATLDAVDVISMSLGLPGTPDDPWPLAVDAAVEQGIVVAVSAGNSGPDYNSVESPGVARLAITVGASDKADLIASFSSRGPIAGYESWLKPDILAPGVSITSTYLGGTYAVGSGTSMAAPHVAGAAALVRQMHPDWAPAQIKSSLLNTALDLGVDVHTQGAGRLQVDRAASPPGLAAPASASFGTVDLSQPFWSDTRLFWLENPTSATRDYTLSLEAGLPDGVSVSVEPASMTLFPGENRSFSLVLGVDSRQTAPNLERNEGVIRIQQGDQALRIPYAFSTLPLFSDSRVLPFGLQTSYAIALVDLDHDGDRDAFVGNTSYYSNPANTVWFNDGGGNFSDSGQRLGNVFTWDVAIGDLDGDGDFDAFAANSEVDAAQPDEIWLNDGRGFFTDSGQRLGNTLSRAVALGDLDGDSDLDAFVVNGISERGRAEADTVWLNNGQAVFSNSGQSLGDAAGLDVGLGDLDGDGDLDAFVANGDPERVKSEPNQVWLNNGQAVFSDSGQSLGNALSQAVALGDLDADADLDAFVANGGPAIADGQPDEVWWNDGSGSFANSGQSLGSQSSYGAALGDIHQDGTLDVFVAGYQGGNRVWLNDGSGKLTLSSPKFGTENATDVALGDVDGDGDVDALVANGMGKPNRLWLNRGSGGSTLALLTPPSGLTATGLTATSIYLTWTDNAAGETSYRVERSVDGSTGWTEIGVLPENSVSHTDVSVNCGQTYFYRVRAYRGSDGVYSAYSHLANHHTDACNSPLPAPSDLTANPVSQSQVNLTWTDNASDETDYRVERSTDGATGWVEIAILPANTNVYAADGLRCSALYYFRVRAFRAPDGQYSQYSNTAAVETDRCAPPIYLPIVIKNTS